jgi:hypothetical protein
MSTGMEERNPFLDTEPLPTALMDLGVESPANSRASTKSEAIHMKT